MDKPSTSGARPSGGKKNPWQIQITFFCPLCPGVLLCSMGSTANAASATEHFRKEHPSYSKDTCKACLEKHSTAQERIQCMRAKNAEMKKIDRIATSRVSVNVRPKRKWDPIQLKLTEKYKEGPKLEDRFPSAASAHLIGNDFSLSTHTPPYRSFPPAQTLRDVTSAPLRLAVVPLPAYETSNSYVDYLVRLYERADPNAARGKAVRLLACFEKDAFFHLFVFWKQVETFKRLCDERPDLIKITEFYCFCDSTTSNERTIETKLHLHVLARIPNEKEFKKQLWNRMKPDQKRVRCKGSIRIQDFDHFFNTILYVSQRKKCRANKYCKPERKDELQSESDDDDKNSDDEKKKGNDDEKKHFAMNVTLSEEDRLYLALAFPTLALNLVHRINKLNHLQHYDLHRVASADYRSELADVLGQIDYFELVAPNDTMLDAEKDRIVASLGVTAKEFLLKFCGNERFVRWKRTAKTYCKMKFELKTITHLRRETVTWSVKFRRETAVVRNEATKIKSATGDPEHLRAIFACELKKRNLHLRGIVGDIQKIRRWFEGCNRTTENRFTFVANRTRFDVTFEYEGRRPISDSDEEDEIFDAL